MKDHEATGKEVVSSVWAVGTSARRAGRTAEGLACQSPAARGKAGCGTERLLDVLQASFLRHRQAATPGGNGFPALHRWPAWSSQARARAVSCRASHLVRGACAGCLPVLRRRAEAQRGTATRRATSRPPTSPLDRRAAHLPGILVRAVPKGLHGAAAVARGKRRPRGPAVDGADRLSERSLSCFFLDRPQIPA